MTSTLRIATWRERIGATNDFPLHAPTDVERAMVAEIAALRAELAQTERAHRILLEHLRGAAYALLAARDMVSNPDHVAFIARAIADPEGLLKREYQTFAWAALAKNGNVIIWSRQRTEIEAVAARYGRPVVPVVAISVGGQSKS